MGKIKNIFKDKYISPSITLKEQFGYCGGLFGNTMGQDSVGTYDDKFCRNFMGISNERMLLKDNVTTILGFIAPPIAGAWYDTPSRGKISNLRKALFVAPIPFAITSLLLFIVPTGNPFKNFLWALFLGMIFLVSDAFYDIAMNTLGLKLCTDTKDRKNFYTLSALAGTLGSMLPGWVIPIIIGTTDDVNRQKWLYFFVALVFCVLGVASMYLPFLTIKERAEWNMMELNASEQRQKRLEEKAKAKEEKKNVRWNKETVKAILHNRPFMILILSTFFESIRKITYKVLPYLYDDVFDKYGMKSIIDMISGALSYVGLFAVPFVGNKVSARDMMIGGYGYTAFFYLIMILFNFTTKTGLNKDDLWVEGIRKKKWFVGALIGMAGMPNAAREAARKIIVADSSDYMEWYSYKTFGTAVRSDGILSSVKTISDKATELLRTNLYNICFTLIKYKAKDPSSNVKPVQTSKTIRGIYLMATLCGFIGNLIPMIIYTFDNFTGKRKEMIIEELKEIRALRNDASEAIAE